MDSGGNLIREWFGHRVYPEVFCDATSLRDQTQGICPFLTGLTGADTPCVKPSASHGVCTISSPSNGPRQDWLVCPNRALTTDFLERAARDLLGSSPTVPLLILPAAMPAQESSRQKVVNTLVSDGRVAVSFQERLGGEISIPGTDRSPEISFDITLVSGRFHETILHNRHWLAERIEGPNKANVFKRTFYQLIFTLKMGHCSTITGEHAIQPSHSGASESFAAGLRLGRRGACPRRSAG